ncbi:CubicO group peptidase (beta-lactamase class C family) [Nocardiopsis sp. Huas11]|uniref:serine hydrolase domain-containing protein n=1 Tax=Nocardiopsis sp. Huas11 TaxID=2183912 RepID=UPI000EAC08C8|nr:serine hydrolase domain-containing protein [Nocardiopsis sp. Huas11]RKS08674.1 CubicO group peptidase (beta-lactamase class C family) [Nocardiopsis sp. Huas11]
MLSRLCTALAILVSVLVLVAAQTAPAAAAPGSSSGPAAAVDTDRIDRYVQEYVRRQGLAGVSVAVVSQGRVLHTGGYGHDSQGRPVTADTPMLTASLSKAITAMAVMLLVEEGEIALDDPVTDHLPEYDPVDPRAERITVRQLLDQTSGMASQGLLSPDRRYKQSPREAVAILATMELGADPGARHHYYSGNYYMLARLVEVVSGQSFGDYLDDAVLAPLGMADSGSAVDGERAVAEFEGLENGHVPLYGMSVPLHEPPDFFVGSGGVVATAADMGRWLAPFTSGGRTASGEPFVSGESIDTLLTPSGPQERYAMGWRPVPGEDRMAHGGTLFGYTAYQTVAEERSLGVVVLNNSLTPLDTAQPLAVALLELAQGSTPDQPVPVHRIIDAVLGALALVTVGLGVRRVLGARAWALRMAGRPRWRAVARSLPRLLPLALIAAFVVLGALSGAKTSVVWALGVGSVGLTALPVWLVVAALANTVTVVVRWYWSERVRSGSAGHQP